MKRTSTLLPYLFLLLSAVVCCTLPLTTQAQFVALPVAQASGTTNYGGHTVTLSGAGTTTCNTNGGNGTAQAMGRDAGLTIALGGTNSAAVGWGIDIYNINFNYANSTTSMIRIPSSSSRADLNGADDIAWGPETNLAQGKIVLRGTSSLTYNNGGTQTIPIRVLLTFTTDGSTPNPVSLNGDIAYVSKAAASQVNIKIQADATYINNRSPLWLANCAGHTGWQPALTIFDDLSTTTANQVRSGFNASWYDLSGAFTTSVTAPSGVTIGSQSPTTYNGPYATNSGIEIAGRPGGVTYTVTNSNGASSGCYGFGFDPGKSLGLSYNSGTTTVDGFYGMVDYHNQNSTSATNLSNGVVTLFSASNVLCYSTTNVAYWATVTTKYVISFMNTSNAAIPIRWEQGKIFAPLANGASSAVKINVQAFAYCGDLNKSTGGTGYTPAFNGLYSVNSGWQPFLHVYDYLRTSTSYQAITSVTFEYYTLPQPSATITVAENSGTANDGTVCAGAQVTLTAAGGGIYSWSPSITNGVAFTPGSTTTYYVTVTEPTYGCKKTNSRAINVIPVPTTANAGPDQTVCGTSTTLAANNPGSGTGSWSIVTGSGGSFGNSSAYNSSFTGSAGVTYTLRWTISNSPCNASTNDVNITFVGTPTSANAGPDQDVCGNSTTLAANNPVVGTGAWSIVSGSGGSFGNSASPTSTFSGNAGASYTLRWTISNSPCTASTNDVVINFKQNPSTSNAGPDQNVCGTSATLAANNPSIGTGAWSIISGSGGNVTSPGAYNSTFNGTAGTSYTLRWTISNNPCTASTNDVVINLKANPSTSNAGPDQTVCGTSATLAANNPTVGTGAWSIVTGSGGSFGNTSAYNSSFSGTAGTSYTLRWTISNSPCTPSTNDVVINLTASPTTSNAGSDQNVCGTSTTLAGNNPTVGTGVWSIVSGTGGSITTPTNRNSGFSGTAGSTYVLRWTISNSPCTASTDDVQISFTGTTVAVNAGSDQNVCGTSVTLAGSNPSPGSGTWTIISGTGGNVTTPTSATSTFNGTAGSVYTLRWTVTNPPCATAFDEVVITLTGSATTANAGADQDICGTNTTLAGNNPSSGTGAWSIISGTGGSIANTALYNSGFSGVAGNTYVLRWTISNSPCSSSTDDVQIQFKANPTTAAAGSDQTICGTSVTLAGNNPSVGTGVWTITTGTGGTIATPTAYNSGFNGVAGNSYTLRWTISNLPCTESFDEVVINLTGSPTGANAGADQDLCGTSTVLAGNTPAVGTGAWSVFSGSGGSFGNSASPTSTFNGTAQVTYTLRWTITNAPCAASFDDVTVALKAPPTTAAAGSDQTVCAANTSLTGNTPSVGTGTWTIISGSGGSINSINNPTSTFSGTPGVTYTLRWTITNAPCTASFDEVDITFVPAPSVAAAGADQVICNGTSTTLAANTPSSGTGSWSIVSGSGGSFGNSSSPTSTFSGILGTTYVLRWTISNAPCTATTDDVTIEFKPNVTASVSIASSHTIICSGINVTFTATPTHGGSSPVYQWKLNGGNVGSNSDTYSNNTLVNNDQVSCEMTSNESCVVGSPATSNTVTIQVVTPVTPAGTVTTQPTCTVPSGTITITNPTDSYYEFSWDGTNYFPTTTLTGVAPGDHTLTSRLIGAPTCVSASGATVTVNAAPSPLPAINPVIICQGGTGELVATGVNCVDNFTAPTLPNRIYGGWLTGSPTATAPAGLSNTTACSFTGPANRSYQSVPFQVSVTGNYVFTMNDNATYNGAGYITTGNFTPGTCGSGTLVRIDNDGGSNDEPVLGSTGNPMTLTVGVTYYLVSTTEGASNVTGNDYTWTITPPSGGNVLLNQPGVVYWFTAASGGTAIDSGTTFNPVGANGSGLTNTNTAGTWSYWAACSSSPDCRTQADFTISTTATVHTVTPNTNVCYDPSSPITIGLSTSTNGLPYQLNKDGVAVGSTVNGNGGAISFAPVSAIGVYTVTAESGSCHIPMSGSVEIKPVPVANAGADVNLPCGGGSITLSGSSNTTTLATDNFGTNVNSQVTANSSGWKVKYLYGSEPANRSEWWISYNGANPYGSNMNNPVGCLPQGGGSSGLIMLDHRIYQTIMPCDYAWDEGDMDEIAYSTSAIDARLYTSVNVAFDYMVGGTFSGNNVYDYLQVMYSLDNGTTWTAVSAGNNAGSYTLYRQLDGTTNAFFSSTPNTPVTGTASVTMPAAVAGQKFLLGFRWVNDGDLNGAYVGGPMIDNISVTGAASYSWAPTAGVTGANTANPTITVAATYNLVVTAGNGCTATDNVVVSDPPVATYGQITAGDQTGYGLALCSDGLRDPNGISFSTQPTNSPSFTYLWYYKDVPGPTPAAAPAQGSGVGGWTSTGVTTQSYNPTPLSIALAGYSRTYACWVTPQSCGGADWAAGGRKVTIDSIFNQTVTPMQCLNMHPIDGDNFYIMTSVSGGTGPYNWPVAGAVTYGAGSNGAINNNNRLYQQPVAWTGTIPVTDALGCAAAGSANNVSTPSVFPDDIPSHGLNVMSTEINVADCYDLGFDRWVSYFDPSNEIIMAINARDNNLGHVNVTVYREPDEPVVLNSAWADGSCYNSPVRPMERHFMVTTQNASNVWGGTNKVGVRLYFTDTELQDLITETYGVGGSSNWNTTCSTDDDVTSINDLYVTKYTGTNEDGDYSNNNPQQAGGIYRLFGDNLTLPNNGPLKRDNLNNTPNKRFNDIYGGSNAHHFVEMEVTEFSEFWLHGSKHLMPLPVTMLYLEANAINNAYIELRWATSVEVNNDGFAVERSTDGQNWSQIGWVDGHDNATTQNDYSYNDLNVTTGIMYYYRLKQVDNDGAFEYTDIVSAKLVGETTFSIKDFMPNPTTNKTELLITATKDQEITVTFYDIIGQKVMEGNYWLTKDVNRLSFELGKLAGGTYTAVLTSANEVYTKKIVLAK